METKAYKDRYTKTVKFDNETYALKSADGCFWDIFVADALISANYTNYANAYSEVMNGEIRDWYLNPAVR